VGVIFEGSIWQSAVRGVQAGCANGRSKPLRSSGHLAEFRDFYESPKSPHLSSLQYPLAVQTKGRRRNPAVGALRPTTPKEREENVAQKRGETGLRRRKKRPSCKGEGGPRDKKQRRTERRNSKRAEGG